MTARELRQKYLAFFASKGHTIFPSGSLVPYDVTGKLDESLLFNGAGMVQFKPYFRGIAEPSNRRLTTAQKCVRTGDIENVGNPSHLTFFEMLGNFSFGDYFQNEAIDFSWEFLTAKEWLGLDPARLSFTVFDNDDVAFAAWSKHVSAAGLIPEHRIFRLGEETNYWPAGSFSAGPPGPCGPNSEMFYWANSSRPAPTGPYTVEDWLRDDDAGNWLEIWNDVFIQYEWRGHLRNPERPNEGYVKEGLDNLPFQSVDTGMGLDRTVVVLNNLQSVYQTDLFQPILRRILGQMKALPPSWVNASNDLDFAAKTAAVEDSLEGRAVRIIADHIRTACFCIADGVLPSNTGRGYVLRRLIRRAVLKGLRHLSFDKPFFHLIYDGVVESMGEHYTELIDRQHTIVETLRNEDALFRRTVERGADELNRLLDSGARSQGVLNGADAFHLYDTYGFPLEVTTELCAEAGVTVDQDEYEAALQRAQELSRGASAMETVYGDSSGPLILIASAKATPESLFIGYTHLEVQTEIVQISPLFGEDGKTNGRFQLSLGASPFYAESGGQVGDTGRIKSIGHVDFEFEVTNTWKSLGLIWCDAILQGPSAASWLGLDAEIAEAKLEHGSFFQPVIASVDVDRRRSIARNHSATHLLHAALRHVLGPHVAQAGSLVSPDHLRFDFSHGKAMTDEERSEVERLVNEAILSAASVNIYDNVPITEAKKSGAMALFGEKYGDFVRMVEIPGLSVELCGGCHVNSTSDVGIFLITHEGSAASGVRRIEAATGRGAYELVRTRNNQLVRAADLLKSRGDVVGALERTLDSLREERRRREKAEAALVRGSGDSAAEGTLTEVGSVKVWTHAFRDVDPKIAANKVDEKVASDPNMVALVAVVADGKLSFICKVGDSAQKSGAHAGNIVRDVAKVAGGGGGGRPDFATAGGKDVSKVKEALDLAPSLISA